LAPIGQAVSEEIFLTLANQKKELLFDLVLHHSAKKITLEGIQYQTATTTANIR
jgi:hypothetical protein